MADAGTHKAYTGCSFFCQAPFLPSTPLAIVINSCLITSNHLLSASLAYYTPILSKYFKEKHCWSEKKSHNRLVSISQGIQKAPHRMPVSIIQAPKWTLAHSFHSPSLEASPVPHLSKVLSLSRDTQPCPVLSPDPNHLAPTVVHSQDNTQVCT